MVRTAGGVPTPKRGASTNSTSCSGEIDWIAEEHDEPQQASEHFEDEELEGNVSFKRRWAWSQEEDEILIQMVNVHSSKDWSSIAHAVPGRSRKQCRDRWTHYLDPAVNQMAWSEQEEIDLICAHKIHGNKWCELAKLFPGRTGKAIKNYWTGAMKKKMKSYLGSGSPEQLSPCHNDPLIPVDRDSITPTSSQDSSKNIQVSSYNLPVRPKSKQGLTEACRNACTLKEKGSDSIHDEGSVPHSDNVSQMVDGQTVEYMPILTAENLISSVSSVDPKVSCAAVDFSRSLKKEESTKFREVAPDLFPARSFQASNVHSDVICSNADPESQELYLADVADLLDMPYCQSLLIVPPDSPSPINSTDEM